MTDLGKVQRYLGILFEQAILGTFLHQRDYTRSILHEFGMADCKPTPTPLPKGNILTTDMSTPYIDSHYYCRLVDKLIFLTVTRPDIAYVVSRLSTHMALPQESHLDAAKHFLRYLQGTSDFSILYKADSPLTITGYTDADWGSSPETRQSMGAYTFTLVGGPITQQSKRKTTVSRSSTESEHRALNDSTQEAVWLRRLLLEL